MADRSGFAGAVVLGDLDDFIAPSQACVNPIIATDVADASAKLDAGVQQGMAKISLDSGVFSGLPEARKQPDLIKPGSSGVAQVSLADCLACSGCVTSAEAVLIQQQSHEELLRALGSSEHSDFVMTVSPQALASLAADAGLDLPTAAAHLTAFLTSLGVTGVADTSAATALAQSNAAREFLPLLVASLPPTVLQDAATLKSAPTTLALPAATLTPSPPGVAVTVTEGTIAITTGAHSGTSGTGAAAVAAGGASPPKRPRRTVQWTAPPVTLAVSSTRCKIVLPGALTAVNHSGDGAPLVNLDGGASAPGVVVDSATGTAVDADGSVVQLTGPSPTPGPRRQVLIDLCAQAGVPLPGLPAGVTSLPVLASACPGWVCYAEKTHPAALRHISRGKSPQALAGEVLKAAHGPTLYHATLMPCFDKKLEASRKDMYSEHGTGEGEGVKLVDCVVTPEEILALLRDRGFPTLAAVPLGGGSGCTLDCGPLALSAPTALQATSVDAGGSGGYATTILHAVLSELCGVRVQGALPWKAARNADFTSVTVTLNGAPLVEVAVANGFRNIQTIITRLKGGRCTQQYVEVMACGGGCPNGGGQARVQPAVDEDGVEAKPTLAQQRARVTTVTTLLGGRAQGGAALQGAVTALADAVAGAGGHTTSYHAMPSVGTASSVKW